MVRDPVTYQKTWYEADGSKYKYNDEFNQICILWSLFMQTDMHTQTDFLSISKAKWNRKQ